MRRGSATVVVLTGTPHADLLPALGRAPNVATIESAEDGGLDAAAGALRRAESVRVPFAVIPVDPLEGLSAQWRRMWERGGAEHSFEEVAGQAVPAWRGGRFELPDYYVVVAAEHEGGSTVAAPHREDFHLGFLASERPSRVVAVPSAEEAGEEVARVLNALSTLPQGPWWPPLDRLAEAAQSFFPGGLGEAPARAEVL